jgi:hypothetical protein
MKKIFYTMIALFTGFQVALAADSWIFATSGVTGDDLKNWNIHIDNIPNMIRWVIDFLLWVAGTIAIIFVIVWAYQILFWSLSWDKSKWKNTIVAALIWFALASLAWFIIRFVIDNFVIDNLVNI